MIVGPERHVIFYNKPHDGNCYAHVTVLQHMWDAHTVTENRWDEHIFHVTIHLPGSTAWRLVSVTTDNVYYRPALDYGYGI